MYNNGKQLVTSVGGPVPVSLWRGLTIWGMTKAERDWLESTVMYIRLIRIDTLGLLKSIIKFSL